jgi:hypothetical protein
MPLEYYRKREIPEYGGIVGIFFWNAGFGQSRLMIAPNRSHVDSREITPIPALRGSGVRHAGCLTRKEDA